MRCKFCKAELVEESTVCPQCGKDNDKNSLDMLQKRVKTMKTALLITLAVLLVAAVAAVVVISVWGGMTPEDTEETVASSQATIPTDGNPEDQTSKGSYTATDDQVTAAHDTVVATMGDTKLTNGQFAVYYWNAIYDFLSDYGSYAAYFGLDITQPLDKQTCTVFETSMTWQQAFVMQGINAWKTYQSVVNDGKAAGFTMPAAYEEALKNLRATMESSAEQNKFESVEAMLVADFGAGCTYEDYYSYMETYYYSSAYYEYLTKNMEISEKEIQDFYEKNKETLSTQYGITDTVAPLISVRHILIKPEGGTSSSTGTTYTEAQWEACRIKAQSIYDEWKSKGATENGFIEAAKANSQDSNAKDGGIYEDVYKGRMVQTFNDWCFDESRQYGDHGLVKTQYGYHIMFFLDSYTGTHPVVTSGISSEKLSTYVEDLAKKCDAKVDYKQILVTSAQLAGDNK